MRKHIPTLSIVIVIVTAIPLLMIAVARSQASPRTSSETTIEPASRTRITVSITVEGDPYEVGRQVRRMLSAAEGDQVVTPIDVQ